jgi:hypothetical protein
MSQSSLNWDFLSTVQGRQCHIVFPKNVQDCSTWLQFCFLTHPFARIQPYCGWGLRYAKMKLHEMWCERWCSPCKLATHGFILVPCVFSVFPFRNCMKLPFDSWFQLVKSPCSLVMVKSYKQPCSIAFSKFYNSYIVHSSSMFQVKFTG